MSKEVDEASEEEKSRITVGDLRKELSFYSDDTEITFGHTLDAVPLVFYRVKTRGDKLVQIELNELYDEGGASGETIEDNIRALILEELYEVLFEAEPDIEAKQRRAPLHAGERAIHVLRNAVDRRLRELHPAAYDRMGRRIVAEAEEDDDEESEE